MGYNGRKRKMKKLIIAITAMVAVVTLSSFVFANHHSSKTEMGNDYIYYTKVTAWYEATESTTLYIYYKEGNGVRKYYSSCGDSESMTCLLYVGKNKNYQNRSCNDYRRNYKYRAYYKDYYFNCNLPYMVEHNN